MSDKEKEEIENYNAMIIDRFKKQVNARFFPYDPTTWLIITNKYTFVEQYHRGGDPEVGKKVKEKYGFTPDCFREFVPVLQLENSSIVGHLMQSHFKNIWNSEEVSERDLRKGFIHDIQTYEDEYEKGKVEEYIDDIKDVKSRFEEESQDSL